MTERTRQQIKNTQKLIEYLEGLPEDYKNFEMSYYCEDDMEDIALKEDKDNKGCGTSACVVGHGPSAGIKVDDKFMTTNMDGDIILVDWQSYSIEAFGFEDGDWNFCFSPEWSNSVEEAVTRLKIANKGKTPDEFLTGEDDYSVKYANT